MIRRALFGLTFGLAASCAYAQAPSPADVGISKGPPTDTFKLLDSSKTWTPFGTVNPSTHIFMPATNGAIAPNDCLKWGPGITSAGAVCNSVTGGAHPANQLTIYTSHAGLLANVTTPTEPWTVMQQGFYAPGDAGAATYDWNATSFCSVNQGGGTPTPDGVFCVRPIDLDNSLPGRYLLRLAAGKVDARQMGFSDDGRDNSPIVDAMISSGVTHYDVAPPIVFSANSGIAESNFYFSKPFDTLADGGIICGDGSRLAYTKVNLVFMPDVPGIRFFFSDAHAVLGHPTWSFNYIGTVKGCAIVSLGHTQANTTIGNPVVPMPGFLFPFVNGSKPVTMPQWAVGDSAVLLNGPPNWYFNGYVTPGSTPNFSTLTVTTTPSGGDGGPGIQVGQALQNGGIPFGINIQADATHFPTNCSPNCTGTGGVGTYGLSSIISSPALHGQAIPSGTLGSSGSPVAFNTEVPSGPPLIPPGTTITGCSTLSGSQCPPSAGATITLSNAPNATVLSAFYALPGPNNVMGSKMYNVTTSTTGHTYGPITAGISGTTMTVTAGAGSLNMGQMVIGVLGTPVTGVTTTGAMTLGQYSGIPVSSCTGVVGGQYVVAFHSGNPVFPPGTTVTGCSGGLLAIDVPNAEGLGGSVGFASSATGSNVLLAPIARGALWLGMPANTNPTGPGAGWIPAGTTVTNYRTDLGSPGYMDITLSNPVTGTTDFALPVIFGGAVDAAPSGTALTFLNGAAHIIEGGTGTGGNGTYTLEQSVTLAPGSTVYAYDTPSTIYITGGPRLIMPQELLWSDAVPWGAISGWIFGTSPSKETIIMRPTVSYGNISALVTHTAGTGKMWTLPAGIHRATQGVAENNNISGFAPGLNMACASGNYRPSSGCGQSYDARNAFSFNIIGRLVVGNNAGGSASEFNEYDHNAISDIADLSTVGSTYIGEMLQGEDESSNTNVVRQNCSASMPVIGAYASGSQWSGTCTNGMVMDPVETGGASAWSDAIFGAPWNVFYGTNTQQPFVNCTGAPTSSFSVVSGIVTHC